MRVHFRHGSLQGLENMAQNSFALLTNLGRAKEAAALANGTAIIITHIAIGDGTTVPSGGETSLYNEVARKAISGHGTVIGASNVAYFDIFLAAADGPYTIREAGLYDNAGDLIAIARYDPPISKPVPSSGQTVEGTVRLQVAFSNIANVTIVVDPSFTVPLQRLSRLPWIPVLSMTITVPPASPNVGDVYLVPTGGSGSWAGQSGKIAEYTAAGWAILTPPNGHGISLPDGRVFEKVGGTYIEKIALDNQSGKWNYAVAAGTANAISATLTPAPESVAAGMVIALKIASSNTGAVTLALNGTAARGVTNSSGGSLKAGALRAGQMATMVFNGSSWSLIGVNAAEIPEVVTTMTMYVRPDGNDNNDGRTNTAAGAKLTVAGAIAAFDTVFVSGGAAIIKLGIPGSYAIGTNIGLANGMILGDAADKESYILQSMSTTPSAVLGVVGGRLSVVGVTLRSVHAAIAGLSTSLGAIVSLSNVALNPGVALTSSHIVSAPGCTVTVAEMSYSGTAASCFAASGGSITLSGAQNFNNCVFTSMNAGASAAGQIQVSGAFSVTGTATGPRYSVSTNGVINTRGSGANFFPGTTAGVTSTGGQYV
ncbi:phage tail-collar fiber domain-containing protein [Brucella anthropi]|uniref:DUF2793 domain-containing protein n=1 Tax=Brucella anthropi TaxID=529 RepID=A0A6L3Z4T1_BRUAN|nr:phage tail protein [Brucella anthropi]KAB2768631.1 DUF2793 domain-containing protein [Brucella anthropi]